jgi:F-type H+-transporting ATPase subunit b
LEHFDWITGAAIPYFNFAIFLAALIFLAKKPMKQMAEDRYKKYVDLHADAKNAFEIAKKQNDELKLKLEGLQSEIEELRKISMENAKHEYDVMVAQAKSLGEHIADEARMIAEAEVEGAKEKIKKEIVKQLTDQVTAKIKSDIGTAEHKEIISNQFSKVEKVNFDGASL